MSEQKDGNDKGKKTIYGTAVGVLKNSKVYLSRRTENVLNPKKWQFVHGRLHSGEQSVEASMRLVKDQMDITITDSMRFKFVSTFTSNNEYEHYFIYLLSLKPTENPINTCDRFRGDWREFELEHAKTLDVLEGTRPVLKKLDRTKLKFETYKTNLTGALTEREVRHLAKLGPKMTRII